MPHAHEASSPSPGSAPSPGSGSSPDPVLAFCWSCRRVIDAGDPYRRWCGKRQVAAGDWYFRPWGIVLLTLTVLGPLALPLAWKSPLLSSRQRQALTWFIIAVTALVVLLAWWTFLYMQRMMSQLL